MIDFGVGDRLGNFCQSVAVLTLSLAARMTEAAVARAAELGAVVSAAVVDGGGHLVHFQRMDRAEIAGPTLAVDKAFTAVAHRAATADLTALAAPGGALAGLHANGGGRYVVFGGGLPCWSGDATDGVVVGGIGVSGGTTEQDVACAEAALDVFQVDHAPIG
jgi:uncharacterized protein GlcG (DUF336 family)